MLGVVATPPQIPGLSDWRPLARGGFATVWQARQESLNRLVAVKVDQRTLEVETEQRRFLREAGAAGRMSGHPGIVTVHDAGILTDDRPYLVMELCPGGSLTRWLKPDARPTEQRVREVGVRIADALAAAHSRGVLHRDVKPANILIDAYNNPGLADFGLAALPDPGMELSETLEALTPAYAPPETFEQLPPTEYGDVYSLAATLYALLKGEPPRWAEGVKPSVGAALEQLSAPIEPIPGVDPALMDLLLTSMANQPTDRPTAAEFRDRLAALTLAEATPQFDDAVADSPAGGSEPPSMAPRRAASVGTGVEATRRRSFLAVALVAALVILAVIVTASILAPDANVAGEPPLSRTPLPAPATTAATSASLTPAPAPSMQVPTGYSDCSSQLGDNIYCAASFECWGSMNSYADSPFIGNRADCYQQHIYQTFAAGQLSQTPLRQSQVDEDPQVKKVCTAKVANSMLRPAARRSDWEIFALPPQESRDDLMFRCVVGRGYRFEPLKMTKPS